MYHHNPQHRINFISNGNDQGKDANSVTQVDMWLIITRNNFLEIILIFGTYLLFFIKN